MTQFGYTAMCEQTPTRQLVTDRARELWRWAMPGWHVMAELPDPRAFDAASSSVGEDDIAGMVPCGPDTGQYVKAVKERPPEGWLVKAFDGDQMVDLIYCLGGVPVTGELLDRAEEKDVEALRLPVLDATDLVLSWLRSFSEHHADFAAVLTNVRPTREQVDWDRK